MATTELKLRAVSNFEIPTAYKLSASARKSGFASMYLNTYPDEQRIVQLSLFWRAFHASFRSKQLLTGFKRKDDLNNQLSMIGGNVSALANKAQLTRVVRNGVEGFNFAHLIGYFSKDLVQIANQWNKLHTDARGGMLPGVEARDLTSLGNIGTLSSVTKGNQLLTKSITSTLSPQLQTVLETCVDSIRVEDTGSLVYVWVDWFISLPEAESLTCNPYPAIRLSQLYMLLRQWILSGWGSVSKMPESSLSLSEIKRSVGRSKDGRTVNVRAHDKAFNLLVTDKSEILYIPPEKETDNVEQYEQLIEAYGLTTDGAYTFAHSPPPTGEGEDNDVTEVAGRTLPRNMPVYVDWVNGKFMYTQGNGLPTVLDLTKSVKLRPFHVTRLLSRTVDQMESYLQYTARCIKLAGGDVDLKPTTVELLASGLSMNDLSDYGYDSHVDGNIMDVLWRLIRIAHRTDHIAGTKQI